MNQYYNPNNEEDYKSFEMTGNSIEFKKEEILNLTLNVINEYVIRTEKGEKNVRPDPFHDSLYVDVEDKTVMIPHDLQNEAINIFLEKKNTETIKYEENKYEENKFDETKLDENLDDELENEVYDEKYKNDSNQTLFYLFLLIIFFAAIMYIFKLY